MAKIGTFIRRTSGTALRAYFERTGIAVPEEFDWEKPDKELVKPLLQLVDNMSAEKRLRVLAHAEQVTAMAGEAGQVALASTVPDRQSYEAIAGAHDRSLWVFLNHQDAFRRAEEVLYADGKRRTKMWDGFVLVPDLVLNRDPATIETFRQALQDHFQSANIHLEFFDRTRQTFDGDEHQLVQITVYREGLPSDDLAFDGGELVRRTRRPVLEAAITFEPETGVIEVVARDKASREALARSMTRDLLGVDFKDNRLPLKRYDLSVLMQPFAFPVDAGDGIDRVDLRLLRLMPIDNDGQRVTLECTSKSDETIWEMAEGHFASANPLVGGFVCTQAKLAIRFHPKPGGRRGHTMNLVVTMPHGCNLKDQTAEQQMIGEKYLRRWGLLQEE